MVFDAILFSIQLANEEISLSTPMQITIHEDSHKATMKLKGFFDINTKQIFQDSYEHILSNSEVTAIDIDFSEVNSLDSSGLGMLLLLREKAGRTGVKISLVSIDTIRKVLEGVFFHKLFTVC